MNNERGFVKNIVAIAVILGVVFLSQQSYSKNIATTLYANYVQGFMAPAQKNIENIKTSVVGKVSGEVSIVQFSAEQEIINQKNNLVQTIWGNVKNFFAQKFSNTFGTQVQ